MPRRLPPVSYDGADRRTPVVASHLHRSLLRLRARVTVDKIVAGRYDEAFAAFSTDLRPATSTLHVVWDEAARKTERVIERSVGATARFDIINDLAVDAALNRSSELIRGISTKTRASIQQMMARSITEGIPPRELAKLIQPAIGLLPRDAGAVLHYRESLAAFPNVDQLVQKYADKLLRRRAMNIARTETIRSAALGQQAAWESARGNGLIGDDARQIWIAAEDERTCETCGGLHDETAPLGGVFTAGGETFDGPPAHPLCRCSVGLDYEPAAISARDVAEAEAAEAAEEAAVLSDDVPESEAIDESDRAPEWPYDPDETRAMERSDYEDVDGRYADWANGVTRDQRDAIHEYSASGYADVNQALRDNGGNIDQMQSYSDRMLATQIQGALDAAPQPPPPDVVWRSVHLYGQEARDAFESQFIEGSTVQLNGFISTSINPEFGLQVGGAVKFEIVPTRGAWINSLSTYKDKEWEFLIPNASKFRVVGTKEIPFRDRYGDAVKVKVIQLQGI